MLNPILFFKRLFLVAIKYFDAELYYRKIGVRFGTGCRFVGDVKFGSEAYLVKLGNSVSITSSSFITHDGSVWVFRQEYPDIDYIKPIEVGNNVFIGADCTILPGVIIGSNTIIGAKSLVHKKLEGGYVYAGVPAKKICTIKEYFVKHKNEFLNSKKMNRSEKKNMLLKHFNFKSADY